MLIALFYPLRTVRKKIGILLKGRLLHRKGRPAEQRNDGRNEQKERYELRDTANDGSQPAFRDKDGDDGRKEHSPRDRKKIGLHQSTPELQTRSSSVRK